LPGSRVVLGATRRWCTEPTKYLGGPLVGGPLRRSSALIVAPAKNAELSGSGSPRSVQNKLGRAAVPEKRTCPLRLTAYTRLVLAGIKTPRAVRMDPPPARTPAPVAVLASPSQTGGPARVL